MKDLDSAAMRVEDFPRSFRFKMVKAYPVVSDVPHVYDADHAEIDAGFARCLENRHLRFVAGTYLDAADSDDSWGEGSKP